MARRSHDFKPYKRDMILNWHNNVCAACGADDALHADHWISGDSEDEGVCLCEFCNVKIKGDKYIPNKFRLIARDSLNIVTHAEYKAQVNANRKAFMEWANQFKYCKPDRKVNLKHIKHFVSPY